MTLDEIVERACRMGVEAVALTDVNNLYGAVAFQRLARARGVKAIVGTELRTRSERATLLARDEGGYRSLCRAITRLHLGEGAAVGPGGFGGSGGASVEGGSARERAAGGAREDAAGGGACEGTAGGRGGGLAGYPAGSELPVEALLRDGVEGLHCIVEDPALAERLAELLPRERLWLELATPGRPPSHWERNAASARALGIGLVATGEVWFGPADDWALHRALRAAACGTLVQRAGAAEGVAHPNSYMATPAQMERRLGRFSPALWRSGEIADDCGLSLESGRRAFPFCSLDPGETPFSRLAAMCREGMTSRFGRLPSHRVARRLERELEVIDKLGFCPYFIIVGEIVVWARGRGIPIMGRGSGASSLVAYLLGITGVDPLRYGLVFERFMNSRRPDYPDLDVDICWRRRDEVIDHVYETYGRDRVALISTHVTFQKRSALREMAKAWGLPPETALRAVRVWERAMEGGEDPGGARGGAEAAGAPAAGRGARGPADGGGDGRGPSTGSATAAGREWAAPGRAIAPLAREPLRTVIAMARRVQGFPRHLGIHCGGLVIAPGPLGDAVPLQRAPKGVVVTQYEMDAVERVGLVKMDLLGNRGLTIAQDCMDLAAGRWGGAIGRPLPGDLRRLGGGRPVPACLEDIPDGDSDAAALLSAGDTLGCFQIESPAMRQLLSMVEPGNSEDVIAAVALVRPGPSGSGMKDAFIRRKRGLERGRFTHPCLAPVLKDTYGVMLYEEDVLKVAAIAAGLTLEDGDDLRRAIAEAAPGPELEGVRRGFLDLAARRGMRPESAGALWEDLARFSSYAFCKAHAAGYGLLAYRSAYLKARYPAEYAVAVLNNHGGMYPTRVHLEDARRRGVRILGPCVNGSSEGFTLDGDAVRVGLSRVKGLRRSAAGRIVEARSEEEGGPFSSLADLLSRVRLNAPEAEALVLAGALDFTGVPRPALLLETLAWSRRSGGRRTAGQQRLLAPDASAPGTGYVREFDSELRLEMEGRHLGLTPSRHPVAVRRPRHPGAAEVELAPCGGLRELLGRRVGVVGVVSARRRIRTESGRPMLFLTIEDASGLVEAVVFPETYRRATTDLDSEGPLFVSGKVEDHYGALTLVADRVAPASSLAEAPDASEVEGRPSPGRTGRCAPWGGG
jgi:DNA-directed DNA polymerase III PolC